MVGPGYRIGRPGRRLIPMMETPITIIIGSPLNGRRRDKEK
jgi:hypothetical protein